MSNVVVVVVLDDSKFIKLPLLSQYRDYYSVCRSYLRDKNILPYCSDAENIKKQANIDYYHFAIDRDLPRLADLEKRRAIVYSAKWLKEEIIGKKFIFEEILEPNYSDPWDADIYPWYKIVGLEKM